MSNPDVPASGRPNGESKYDEPLRVEGFTGTPEEIERKWFDQVFRGRGDSMAQLTLRAVLMGTVLGGILSLTNLYIGLKAGWGFGVTITACIVSYGVWSVFLRLGLAKTPMTILENNCMQSTSSSAGYSTGTTLVSAFPAYFMINNQSLPFGLTLAWVFFLAILGVTMAIPMKRQMINVEQLRFPTGIATAETLRALYSKGERAMQSARALTYAGVLAAISQFWSDGLRLVSSRLEPFGLGPLVDRVDRVVFGPAWIGRTVTFVWDPIFIAAGTLMGIRAAGSIFLGGTLCWAVFVPVMQARGVIAGTGYREVVQWTLWGGVSCMVVSGLLAFFMQWRSILKAFRGVRSLFGGAKKPGSELDAIETPISWFITGQLVSLVAVCWLAKVSFNMPVWQSIVAVAMSFFLALVACRVTGETDTTPTGAMGKVTQLVFGALNPGNMNINLMSANITSSAAISSADLLTDLKSGYLLGANSRKQFIAQFCGIFIGTLATVVAYRVMVPTVSVLGSDQFPAPAAQAWRAVALALSKGFEALEAVKIWSIAIGGVAGALLTLLPRWFPRHAKWMPSAAGVGLSWTFHWYYGFLFFVGAFAGWLMERRRPEKAELYNYPVAAGVIAGGSLMGVALIFWENGPVVFRQLFGGG
ncbi:MAG TPA: OPT family oligopeptide transporter [Opitutaceae bacterium]|nr:OPT family oligopeptide transporter [Opitutaceae bacterium]